MCVVFCCICVIYFTAVKIIKFSQKRKSSVIYFTEVKHIPFLFLSTIIWKPLPVWLLRWWFAHLTVLLTRQIPSELLIQAKLSSTHLSTCSGKQNSEDLESSVSYLAVRLSMLTSTVQSNWIFNNLKYTKMSHLQYITLNNVM